jgi:hypothetical protein
VTLGDEGGDGVGQYRLHEFKEGQFDYRVAAPRA